MSLTGKLRTWHDDRGFGFIAPTGGGGELFVHISAFPRDGSRPTIGETLTYEVGPGKDGKPQAVRVIRQAIGHPSTYPARSHSAPTSRSRSAPTPRRSLLPHVIALLLLVAMGAYGYRTYQRHWPFAAQAAAETAAPAAPALPVPQAATASPYRCDGRTHCSQMTSCAEAKFFLQNCPGTKMDGNNDGVPCEQQWCTSPFAP
jgi:cold shock CspA family protein